MLNMLRRIGILALKTWSRLPTLTVLAIATTEHQHVRSVAETKKGLGCHRAHFALGNPHGCIVRLSYTRQEITEAIRQPKIVSDKEQ